MKKIFVVLSMVAFLAACDDSASAGNNEPTTLSGAEGQGSSSSTKKSTNSSDSRCEECNDEAISSSGNAELNGFSRFSSCMDKKSSSSSVVIPGSTGNLTDERDGKKYKTVKIGDQWWMAVNLNYETDNSFCYNDSAEYCEKYGRLYSWAAAMDSAGTLSTNGKGCGYGKTCSPTYPVRGACPEGWHLPTQREWNTLFTAVGGSSTAGTKLKSTSGWYNSGSGTDAFSFSALPAGYRYLHGYYDSEGEYANFWSSTEGSSDYAYNMYLDCFSSGSATLGYDKRYGFSVRCLKD